jgi:hypothetical protein
MFIHFYVPLQTSFFKQDQAKGLAVYVFVMENRFFGLMLIEMRGLAFDLDERKEIYHNFNKTIKMAG